MRAASDFPLALRCVEDSEDDDRIGGKFIDDHIGVACDAFLAGPGAEPGTSDLGTPAKQLERAVEGIGNVGCATGISRPDVIVDRVELFARTARDA